MANEVSKKHRPDVKKTGLLSGLFKEKPDQAKHVTVKEEKTHVRRVLKIRPRSIKHASEAMQSKPLSDKDMEITEEVMQNISPCVTEAPKDEPMGFDCLQCGYRLPTGAERCPKCNSQYVEVSDEDLKELESAENDTVEEHDDEDVFDKDGVPCIHFDAESGTIVYLRDDDSDSDFVVECSHCGTAIQFDTDRCPICGTKLESPDSGLVSLFSDMKFDEVKEDEMDCPMCGEHVTLIKGKCPSCSEIVLPLDPGDSAANVHPVIQNDNVVFMHLDVETGDLNYLQRLAKKLGFEQLTVHLDSVGMDGFEQNWKSLSRI